MENKAIVLRDVAREYEGGNTRIRAVDGVDLSIDRGLMAAVIGPSGSGKSTLLNLIGLLDRPTRGEIFIDAVRVETLSERELSGYRREKVGFVFQDFHLIPNLSALENVMLPMEFARVPQREREQRAATLLERVLMSHRATQRPTKLSGGEQQRVAIARALANDPAIILADEPTGNLDSQTGEEIIALLKEMVRESGKTVVVATHDAEIVKVADIKVVIQDGRLKEGG